VLQLYVTCFTPPRRERRGDCVVASFATARHDEIDRIVGLETGADDYLGKPFEPRELVARLNAVLRRTRSTMQPNTEAVFRVGPLEINMAEMSVHKSGNAIKLSNREFALLAALAQSAGHPLTRAQLIDRAFGRDAEVSDRAIDVQITRLRRAIEDRSDAPLLIKTVRGVGYVFAARHD
jgi:two-component system phosphate regulon response regulator OmpR